jgi:uncharacterized protein (TIGR02145 family)
MMVQIIMQPLFKIFKMKNTATIIFICLFTSSFLNAQVVPQGYLIGPEGYIGNQLWMTKNLDVTTFNDGTPIAQITNTANWASGLSSPGWIYNNTDANNNAVYGKLYNWAVVNNAKNVCPVNYHIPTFNDWLILQNFIGGTPVTYDVSGGGKLKQTGTATWLTPNTSATNVTKFNAVGSGYIGSGSSFSASLNKYALYWSTTLSGTKTYFAQLNYNDNILSVSPGLNTGGFSIRCIHD